MELKLTKADVKVVTDKEKGTTDTLFVGQGGKLWKFLPVSNQ